MGILEHVKVLETKVDKEIDLAKRLVEENAQLKEKVETYEALIETFKEEIETFKKEQAAIENGILSALNRLNQFEDAVEKSLFPGSAGQEAPDGAVKSADTSPQTAGSEESSVANVEPESSPHDVAK